MDIDTLQISEYYQPLTMPLPGAFPCGVNLEYDSDFILLLSRLQPRLDAEYGQFIEAAEPVNWAEIERDCLALLNRSKDIRLLIILMRCRLRQTGLTALEEGLIALSFLLTRWPEDIHPQLYDEGEFDPLMRINALNELEDIHGIIGDLRNQLLPKAAGTQITLKIFEKSHALPRDTDALPEIMLSALRLEWKTRNDPVIRSLQVAKAWLDKIKKIIPQKTNIDMPDFPQMSQLLSLFLSEDEQSAVYCETPVVPPQPGASGEESIVPVLMPEEVSAQVTMTAQPDTINSRTEALSRLKEIRAWFIHAEPSSPVIPLLAFTERTIGMHFNELLKFIPAELISRLDTEKD
ncbi:ImpA family type VI secretion system protein [Cronobacter sakazakii]|nr:ImpA family type VI secretion system protein [Cronobacter sakazakii]